MTFHCDKLCGGECCKKIRRMLRMSLGNTDQLATIANCTCIECTILRALYNPAKRAELMAMALRARGIDAAVERWQITQPPSDIVIWHDEQNIRIYGGRVWQVWRRSLSMAQARDILAAIMRTPADESSKSQCEQIIMDDNHNTTGPTRITHEHH